MLLLLLFYYVVSVATYKILVFSPTISRSHMISNGRIADELAKAGHDVVLFEPDFLNISSTVMSSKIARRWTVYGFSPALRNVLQGFSETAFEQFSLLEEHRGLLLYSRAYNELCEDLINRDELIDALRAEKFDGYFGEQINLCGNGLAHVLGIKSHFWVSSCPIGDHMAWILGMPQPSSFIPSLIAMDITHRPSYIERVQNVWATFLYVVFGKIYSGETTAVFRRKFGPDFPSLEEIAADSDMVFVSTDEFIEFPRPSLPNIVHIGGLGLGTSKETSPLNKVFAEQMEMGANGVIYFSLGTLVNTSSLPAFAMEAVIETARRTPDHHFILVADRHDQHTRQLAEHLKNVFVCSWAPQPAILGHPRLRTFITHGGYNSIMEASRFSVPLITIPFWFDQIRNSHAVELNGWGISVNRFSLRNDPDTLRKAVHEILSNSRYRAAAERISKLIRTKPFNASERLIKYTEFVLANDGMKELLTEGRRLSLVHYYNLDILVPFVLIFIFLCWICFRLVTAIICAAPRKQKQQ